MQVSKQFDYYFRISKLFVMFVWQAMLQQYSADSVSWRAKDAALYLVTSLTSRGQTQKHGITQASSLVSLPDFTAQHILPELHKPDGKLKMKLGHHLKFCNL